MKYSRWVSRVQARGLVPGLSFSEFELIQSEKNCAYCGCIFTHVHEDKRQLTMERINPKRGYIWGNVVPVCRACNEAKSLFDGFFHDDTIPWKTKKIILSWAKEYAEY